MQLLNNVSRHSVQHCLVDSYNKNSHLTLGDPVGGYYSLVRLHEIFCRFFGSDGTF